ncbi:MAG: hypothetical protein E7316_10305 [Clostridiales bacterium]|nr:hypothetical protein [Clostridiales bacterium]
MNMLQQLVGKPRMMRRVVVLFFSVFLMGVGVAILDQLGFGTDPASVMNLGISRMIGWSFGNYVLAFNGVLLVIILLLKEYRRIGLGTIANMVVVGYAADFTTWVINMIHPLSTETMTVKLIVFVPTILMFMVAAAFYMVVGLGVAPYDALPQIISSRTKKLGFTVIRMAWDVTATVIGYLVGGTVGMVTIIMGFFLGPIISAIAKKFQPWFE